uniref:Piwi domain-containing protein n=1 Tax=Trichobilharzia regenti TaxID=157069 RepID=A0AA85IZX4_TRIRE
MRAVMLAISTDTRRSDCNLIVFMSSGGGKKSRKGRKHQQSSGPSGVQEGMDRDDRSSNATREGPSLSTSVSPGPSSGLDVSSSSKEAIVPSETARQKKSHPKLVSTSPLSEEVSKLSLTNVSIPSRPDKGGKEGKPTTVTVNCWDFSVQPKVLYMYRAEVNKVSRINDKDAVKCEIRMSPKDKRDLISHITQKLPKMIVYDGGHDIYSLERLPGVTTDPVKKESPNASKADVASEVIRCAAVRPAERFRELQNFVNNMFKSHPLIKQFSLSIQPKPAEIKARVIQPPTADFGRSGVRPLKAGSFNSPGFHDPAGKERELMWAILSVPPNKLAQGNAQKAIAELLKAAKRFGVRLSPCPIVSHCPKRELNRKFEEFSKQGCAFLLLILYDEQCYSEIKRLSDLQMGIRTQCVRSRTLSKPNVFPNLLLKLNGKLGGVNWRIPGLIKSSEELIMVFGADVTHPAPTQIQQIRKSVAAVIGSVSPDLMRYAVVVRQQATTEKGNKATREIIDDMRLTVKELLQLYLRNTNGRFPTRMIFYRDGVSEGQFENVLVEELAAIQRACADIRPGVEPAITYIVVQKRHHIRLKPFDSRARNVEPGTVVDTDITHPREFDFYLCSQEGIQGTSKPAHYHVLYDDSNWTSDALQMFTYYLCYGYMRCCR